MHNSKGFFLGLLCAVPALVGLVAAAFLLDPRGDVAAVFPAAGHLCQPGIRLDRRSSIPFVAAARRPREVLIGTSRVAYGFAAVDAEHLLQGPVANLALEAARMDEVALLTRQAWSSGTVKRVWIGLDYAMFSDRGERPLAVFHPMHRTASAVIYGLLDPKVLRYTMHFLLRERSRCSVPVAGTLGFTDPARTQTRMTTDEKGFAARLATTRISRGATSRLDPATRWRETEAGLEQLDKLVTEGRRRGVQLVLFVAPMHMQMRALLAETGLGDDYARWLQRVRAIGTNAPDRNVRLVDLSGLEAPEQRAGERCARAGPAGCLFFDPTHYRTPLGRRILEIGTGDENVDRTRPLKASTPERRVTSEVNRSSLTPAGPAPPHPLPRSPDPANPPSSSDPIVNRSPPPS